MTRKPNFAKFMMGIAVLALLFIGTWAATSARLTSANSRSAKAITVNNPKIAPGLASFLSPDPGDDPITGTGGVIELDGDIFENTADGEDWETINCNGGTAQAKAFVTDGLALSIFTQGGSKDPEDISAWRWKDGAVPDKDELLNAYAAKYTGTTEGDAIIAFGTDRYDSSGDAFIGAWFFQQSIYAGAEGRFRQGDASNPDPDDPVATHTVGDVLVLLNFTGGGTSFGSSNVYEWVGVAPCPVGAPRVRNTLCDVTGTATNPPIGVSNATAQDIPDSCPWNAAFTPKSGTAGVIPAAQFFEGGINLDAFPALAGSCFNSFLVETRSSSSVTAQLKDFVIGAFNTCPNPNITKSADSDDVCEGTATVYTYTVSNPAGSNSVDVTLSDDAAGGTAFDPAGATCIETTNGGSGPGPGSPITLAGGATRTFQCTVTLGPGPHTNTVTMTWNSGGPQSDTAQASVTVHKIPDARISVVLCADGSAFLTGSDANDAGGTFAWSGAGSGSNTTTALTGVGNYTLTIDNGFCSDSATRTVSLCSDTDDAP